MYDSITKIGQPNDRIKAFKDYFTELIEKNKKEELNNCIQKLVKSSDTIVSRPSIAFVGEKFNEMEKDTSHFDLIIELSESILEILHESGSFFDTSATIREICARILEKKQEYSGAARMLAGIAIDSSKKSPAEKCAHFVRISQLYLEDEESARALPYMNQASNYFSKCKDTNTKVRYHLCWANIYDFDRKFLKASRSYYDLSLSVIKDDLPSVLNKAMVTAILSPAGPQRSRLLKIMYNDDRCTSFPVYSSVEKMYLQRILREHEIEQMDSLLQEHQRAEGVDGLTYLQKAVIQHNLLAASSIYNNIRFEELGKLLGISNTAAEEIAAKMIAEKRMEGYIDQVENIMYFEDEGASLVDWDYQISTICRSMENVTEEI
eukprot:CAMPEP_0117427964 /NCGR_PEP_ID=MMETSP0758-20121206/7753_1 /TAXON_ID=63605 /ORGANISM="Percolomonas cosmopolitus, Strain AE-1 (ATCC 50343)" /LENGTH=377 /DNA_ID=CAMNT_0005214009 /DNA_START=30 /DNA_END=1160 /DNA_ORIENTATION=+